MMRSISDEPMSWWIRGLLILGQRLWAVFPNGEKEKSTKTMIIKEICKRKVVKTTTKMVKDCQKKSKTFHIFLSSRRKNRNNGDD